MTTQHTPGPWHVTGYHVEARAGAIATVCDAGDDDTEGDANARLISAAPELLAVLREIVDPWDFHCGDGEPTPLHARARAAIAAATGEGQA